jgi:3-dehydroquinate synthase
MTELTLVTQNTHNCRVRIGQGVLKELPQLWNPAWQETVLIGDSRVIELFGDRVVKLIEPSVKRIRVLDFKPGESAKSRRTKEGLEDAMLEAGFDRNTCVVAIGGGISLDLAGLVAATYMRGLAYVNIPTTLLAQVDASIGGKTAVNTEHGKNLVGVFHQPEAILIDSELPASLPVHEWRNGLAEAVKYAVIADSALFEWLESNAEKQSRPSGMSTHLLKRCVDIKIEVVSEDPFETGRRAILNYGHTIGHAIERATKYRVSHGAAVAIGMLVEAEIAIRQTGFPVAASRRILKLLDDLGLVSKDQLLKLQFEEIQPFLKYDKKRRNHQIRMSLPAELGVMASLDSSHTLPVELETIKKAWDENLRQFGCKRPRDLPRDNTDSKPD